MNEKQEIIFILLLWTSSFPNTTYWRDYFRSIACYLHLYQESDGCSFVGLFLGPPFYSIGLHACVCTSAMLVLLLWTHSISWSQAYMGYLQHCYCFPWLFFFWNIWNFHKHFRNFSFCEEWHWNLDRNSIESFLVTCPYNHVNSVDL